MSAEGHAAGLAYRHAGDPDAPPVLLLHGYPESSYMWREAIEALAGAGWYAIAPDLPGFGDSEPDPPGTWERHVEAVERFVQELGLGPVVLVTHDWGVMIGLRWACDHPDDVNALVISDGGFWADRRWHDLANTMRTPQAGEELVMAFTREGFGGALQALCPGMGEDALDEYWKAFADDTRRLGQLELYRSGDFEKLAPYEGRVGALGVPALVLWGENDPFATAAMAERFHSDIPGSKLVLLDGAGHFIWDERPQHSNSALLAFLAPLLPQS
jgi:haloalkane dehalogenase